MALGYVASRSWSFDQISCFPYISQCQFAYYHSLVLWHNSLSLAFCLYKTNDLPWDFIWNVKDIFGEYFNGFSWWLCLSFLYLFLLLYLIFLRELLFLASSEYTEGSLQEFFPVLENLSAQGELVIWDISTYNA